MASEHGDAATPTLSTFFAAPADDPRARRTADAFVLVTSVLFVLVLAWLHRGPADFDARVFDFFGGGVPGWIRGIATIVFVLGGLYAPALVIGIAVFARGRGAIVRDMLVAVALAIVAVIGASLLAGPELPDLLPELRDAAERYPSFPVTRLAVAVAVISVARPYVALPVRRIGQQLVVAMSVSSVVLLYGTVSAVIGGLALGAAAAATVHLVFGSGQGIPSRTRITQAVRELGVEIDNLEYTAAQPVGATLATAAGTDGTRLQIKVYGRDATDAALAARVWRAMWYRDSAGAVTASRAQLAEHEALTLLALERADVVAPRFVGVGRSSTDDVVLVSTQVAARALSALAPEEVTDEVLDAVWAALAELHGAGAAHRGVDRDGIGLLEDGTAAFTDLPASSLVASEAATRADRAQLLVATAVAAGDERAIAAARRRLGDEAVLDVLPLMQKAALSSSLRDDVDANDFQVKRLRKAVAEALGADTPELAQLRRVSWGGVAMAALTLFAAYSLITSLTQIGLDTIVEEFSTARWGWVVVALTTAQLTNVGEYFSLVGVMGQPAPFGPTLMFRYALSFISLAVPSDAGAIAMNIRYQQKLGVPAAAAVAQGPLLTIVSKAVDLLLLVITAQFVSANIELDEVDLGPVVKLLIAVVVAAAIAIAAVAAVPKWRALAVLNIRKGFAAVRGSMTDPDRLMKMLGGTLAQKVLFALTLSASAAAYGASLPFATAIFVNTAVSFFVGLMPVPGGIGVGEAALTAGMIAVGVPEEAAIAAAITHRMCTAYLPPVFGWWAARWLTARDYL